MKSIFPESMLPIGADLTLESIASKFDFFFSQLHLLHLQTSSYAEHNALNLYSDVADAKDSFMEELFGYEGRKVRSYDLLPIKDYSPGMSNKIVTDLKTFAKDIQTYASLRGYSNVENLAQELSGKAAKTLFLLTLS